MMRGVLVTSMKYNETGVINSVSYM